MCKVRETNHLVRGDDDNLPMPPLMADPVMELMRHPRIVDMLFLMVDDLPVPFRTLAAAANGIVPPAHTTLTAARRWQLGGGGTTNNIRRITPTTVGLETRRRFNALRHRLDDIFDDDEDRVPQLLEASDSSSDDDDDGEEVEEQLETTTAVSGSRRVVVPAILDDSFDYDGDEPPPLI